MRVSANLLFMGIIIFFLFFLGIVMYVLHRAHALYHRNRRLGKAQAKNVQFAQRQSETVPVQRSVASSGPLVSQNLKNNPTYVLSRQKKQREKVFSAFTKPKATQEKNSFSPSEPTAEKSTWVSLEDLKTPSKRTTLPKSIQWITLKEFLGENDFDRLNVFLAERKVQDINSILSQNKELSRRIASFQSLRSRKDKERQLKGIFEIIDEHA